MANFYILSSVYAPNTAVTNHELALVHGFDELGVIAEWLFLLPDTKESTIDNCFKSIKISYLWNKKWIRSKLIKHLFKHIAYAKFYFSLNKGDTVLLLGTSSYLHFLVRRKGINVYHERTEHPLAVETCKYKFFARHYNDDCCRTTGLFVISHALKSYFESIGVDHKKVHVVNMIVDSKRFMDIKKDENVEPYIAYCGNVSNLKDGIDNLIESFSLVSKRYSNIKLYIIGDISPKGSNNMDLVNCLGLSNRIVFTGKVQSSEMPQLLVNAKMLALARPDTLQNKYGFPTKLGEYLLSGNPVVVTRVGDIPLFLEDKKTALLSDCGDVKAFADNIIWVLDHPEEAHEIGLRGRDVANQCFNYVTESQKMYKVLFGK